MRHMNSTAIAGIAILLAANLATAQSAKSDVRIERSDDRVNVNVDPRVDANFDYQQDDASPKLKTTQRMPYVVSKRVATDAVLGVQVSPVPPAMAAQLRLRPNAGAVVEAV